MPFTLSHPAIAVPLRKSGLVLSALVIGSMTPDFGFYVAFGRLGDRSHHDLAGLFAFCLPAGLLALWIFHRILKQPLAALLPATIQRRLRPYAGHFRFGPWRRFILVVSSLFVGAVSHLAWDFFTHTTGWNGWVLSLLMAPVLPSWVFGNIRLVEALHGLFSIAGLLALAAMTWRTVMNPPHSPELSLESARPNILRDLAGAVVLLALAVAAFFAAAAGAILLSHSLADVDARRLALYRTVVLTVSFLFAELLILCLAIHAKGVLTRISGRGKQEVP